MTKQFFTYIVLLYLVCLLPSVLAYKIENGKEVHQHITKEAEKVWVGIPDEIKAHLQNDIRTNTLALVSISQNYNVGDDIITGSAEEDIRTRPLGHFWQVDNALNGAYNDGLDININPASVVPIYINRESSYRRARDYWLTYVIPNYQQGNVDASYYYLGRIAHLIEDASQPSHVLLDCHPDVFLGSPLICPPYEGLSLLDDLGRDDSALEGYTGNYFRNYNGNSADRQYNYENLIPGFSETNWRTIDSNFSDTKHLFRLMWYTAQKTQYFASDNKEQELTYNTTSGTQNNWACSGTSNNLWADEGLTSCSDFVTMNELRIDDARQSNGRDYVVREEIIIHIKGGKYYV